MQGEVATAEPRNELRQVLMLAIPTVFDLAATVLMNVGASLRFASRTYAMHAWCTSCRSVQMLAKLEEVPQVRIEPVYMPCPKTFLLSSQDHHATDIVA
jgi:hypothetical protein